MFGKDGKRLSVVFNQTLPCICQNKLITICYDLLYKPQQATSPIGTSFPVISGLEINEIPLKQSLLDFEKLSLNNSSSKLGFMFKQACLKLFAVGADKNRVCFYANTRVFHCGQTLNGPRSFFGVEDYPDDDNSRPYTYQKEKASKNPNRHISFRQRTIAYMEPFTLDVFISKRFVSASITHRVTCKQVATAGTNSKDIKAALKSRSDIPACLAVGRILSERAREADVYTASYTPRERDKFEGKIRAVVQSLIDNGIDIKVNLD